MPHLTVRLTDDTMRRISNFMLREKRPNRSEVLRLLIDSALDASEGKDRDDERLIALGDLGKEQRDGIRALLDELDQREGGGA